MHSRPLLNTFDYTTGTFVSRDDLQNSWKWEDKSDTLSLRKKLEERDIYIPHNDAKIDWIEAVALLIDEATAINEKAESFKEESTRHWQEIQNLERTIRDHIAKISILQTELAPLKEKNRFLLSAVGGFGDHSHECGYIAGISTGRSNFTEEEHCTCGWLKVKKSLGLKTEVQVAPVEAAPVEEPFEFDRF
jgi:FtsZ-binding cell division protein ZapB